MKKIIACRFFFLSSLLLFLINGGAIGQNRVTNGSFATVTPAFGSGSADCRRIFASNLIPTRLTVPNWTAVEPVPTCTDAGLNEPFVVRFEPTTCLQTMQSSDGDGNYLVLKRIYTGANHLCDDRARQNFLQPLASGNYALSLAYRFQPDNLAAGRTNPLPGLSNDPSNLEIVLLNSPNDCDGTTVATIPVNANASNAWVTFAQNFQIAAGQTSSTLVLRLTGVGTNQKSHVFLDNISIQQTLDCGNKQSPLYLSGAVNWTGTQSFNRDVILTAGSSLTITNGTVRFANNCQLIVEGGATLTVNSSTLTNDCGGQWTGIVCRGNVILSGARLEHAVTSVRRESGTVNSNSTIFSNNGRDIEYLSKISISPFDIHAANTFVVNNNYRGTTIRPRVTMWNSAGINFRGCTFDNQYSSSPFSISANPAFEWQGIYAVESNFYVDDLNGTPTIFRNFYAGIRAVNLGQNRNAEIRNSRFENNHAGIISENVNSLVVIRNRFLVNWGTSFPANEWYRVGLLINTGTGYTVRNNDFIGNLSNGGSGQYTFGTQFIRTGDSDNRVEGNRLDNLYVGHRILGNNTNSNNQSPSGLQLLCNVNTQNIYDHDMENDGDFNGGIRALQGNNLNPDGNRFSNNNTAVDIWSDCLPFTRFYQSALPNALGTVGGPSAPTQTPVSPASTCSLFTPFLRAPNGNTGIVDAQKATSQTEGSLVENNNRTVSSMGNGSVLTESLTAAELSELSRDFEEAEAALQASKKQYTELIDGGNQGQLLSDVRTRWNRDTATLRRSLSALSPNLSTEVLIATAQLNALSNQTLMQLLKANPSACRSNKLKKVLTQALSSPFSEADFQSLLLIPVSASRRFDIEDAINTHGSRKGEIGRALISGLMTDQDANKEALRYWWTRIGTRHAQYSLAESYIKDNQSGRYEAQLRNLSRDLTDFEMQMKENDEYVSLYGIKSKVLKSGRSWKEMTRSEIEQVRRIANNTRGDAAVQANNILCYAFGECKPLEVPRFGNREGIQGLKAQTSNASNAAKSANQFVAYPNPAQGTIHVDYNLEGQFEDAYISLIDFTGREIKRQKIYTNHSQIQWQTEQMQSGLYLITIYADKRLVWQTKVSVQK